jgi:Domain of unknown function (DUF4388)
MSTDISTRTVRAPAGFVGSVADTPIAEVLRRLVREERSGDLQVTTPDAIKTVYFDRGFIVFASSDLKNDRLGESLIETGRISRQEFSAASMLMKTTRQKFGRVLVQSGIVSEEELGHLVAAQVNRIVLSLFAAKRGMYSFDERPTVIPMELMVSLSVYRILMEGIRRMTSKKLVLAGLPSLTTEVRVVDRPPFSLDLEKLTPAETEVLRLATDGVSLEGVVARIGGNEGVSLRACYGLVSAGVLGFTSAATAPRRPLKVQEETGTFVLSEIRRKVGVPAPPPPSPETRAPRQAPISPPAEPEPEPVPVPVPVPGSSTSVERSPTTSSGWLGKLWSTVLGWWGRSAEPETETETVAPVPRTPPVRRAAAPSIPHLRPIEEPKRFDVGTRTPSAGEDPLTEPAPAASAIEAESRHEPGPGPELELEPRPAPSAASNDTTDAPRWDVPDWSMAEDPSAQFRDFYEELGIATRDESTTGERGTEESSTAATARTTAASSPDADRIVEVENEKPRRAPSMLRHIPVEAVVPVEERVEHEIEFELEEGLLSTPEISDAGLVVPSDVAEAHELDESPPAREAPAEAVESETPEDRAGADREREMLRMKAGGGEQRLLRDVKLHFQLRDWEGAVPLLEQLVSISPGSALYRGMLARALSRHPARRKDAEEHFVEALRMAPQDPEIHYWLGLYYKSFGLESRAATEFRTTLRIQPQHEGARTQLGAGKRDDALGTVIKKIFG